MLCQYAVHKECGHVLGADLQLKTDSEAKKVAELIERYEAQESLQREWEQNYYAQQKLDRLKVPPMYLLLVYILIRVGSLKFSFLLSHVFIKL